MTKQKIKQYLGLALFYLFLGTLLTANCFGYLDPDFGWHLRVGESIALTKSLPHDQVYMWTLANKQWVDHEWLGNLLTYKLWEFNGYLAVATFFILLPLLAIFILNKYLFKNYLKEQKQRFYFAGIETLALVGCLPHFGVRLQEITFLFTIILFIIIDSCRRRQNIKLAWWLIPLLFLWSCLHGGFLFGVAVAIGWLIYEILIKKIPQIANYYQEKSLATKKIIFLLAIIILTFLGTFLTPYGLKLYSFLSDYGKNNYYMSHIEEWRTPFSISLCYTQIFYMMLIIVLMIASKTYSKKNLPLWKLCLSGLLLIMAIRSVRHFPLWAAGSLIFLLPQTIKKIADDTYVPYSKKLKFVLISCLVLVTLILILKIKPIKEPFKNFCAYYPCGAVQFLKNNPQYGDLKMFNDYGWGGFIIGVWPTQKLFIDGRLPQYDYKNHTILEEYNEFFIDGKVADKLNEQQINLVLFKSKEAPFKPDPIEQMIFNVKPKEQKNPLLEYLTSSADWEKVYSDQLSVIYVRKNK